MAGGVLDYLTAAGSSGWRKRKVETPMEGWYKFYGKSLVYHMGLQSGQAVLQLHPALDLIHHRTVRQGVQVPEFRVTLHRVLLLVAVQEQGMVDAVTHHGKGPSRSPPAWRGLTCSFPDCLTPAYPVTNIFFLMGDIGGWGQGRRRKGRCGGTQEPEVRQR